MFGRPDLLSDDMAIVVAEVLDHDSSTYCSVRYVCLFGGSLFGHDLTCLIPGSPLLYLIVRIFKRLM
jgi:hypothetical protein